MKRKQSKISTITVAVIMFACTMFLSVKVDHFGKWSFAPLSASGYEPFPESWCYSSEYCSSDPESGCVIVIGGETLNCWFKAPRHW